MTALCLIHPLGAWRGVWKPVLPLLEDGFEQVVAVDMPGFGDAPGLPEDVPATAANMAAAVREELEGRGISRAHVAGISLGGWTALEFGKTDAALSVTTLCAAGFWRRVLGPKPELARSTARRLQPAMRRLLSTARGRKLVLSGTVAHPERVPADDAYDLVRAYALSTGFTRANHEMRSDLFSGWEDIRVPVTMAWADRDRSVYPPPSVPDGVEVHRLTDCGHVPSWDSPEQVAAVIRAGAARAVLEAS